MIKEQNNNLETVYIKEEISRCETIDELKEKILPMIKSQSEQWSHKINEIIATSGYTKTKFAELCKVSRVTVDKWCKGAVPRNRESFLKIGMAAGYNIEQMNQLLQRYGQYPGLYSKSLEDCICMYVLGKNYGSETFDTYLYILDKIKAAFNVSDVIPENVTTEKLDAKITKVQDENELEEFIACNIASFISTYHKLYAFIEANVVNEDMDTNVFTKAEVQGWSSSLRQCVSAVRQHKWYPTRNKIISLGLHISMDHEEIDEMLEMAHMEPLCAKNIFESVIMFILDDASLNNIMDDEAEDYDPDMLCKYAKEVFEQLELPELDFFISEVSEIDNDY